MFDLLLLTLGAMFFFFAGRVTARSESNRSPHQLETLLGIHQDLLRDARKRELKALEQ